MRRTPKPIVLATVLSLVGALAVLAQDYDIDWHTIDGGGVSASSANGYELSGTIGQHDAGALAGDSYALTGGFWKAAAAPWAIPAVSAWGMLGMTLLLLVAAALVYEWRRPGRFCSSSH